MRLSPEAICQALHIVCAASIACGGIGVFRLFVRLALFDEDQAAGMLTWPHSGFHVHTAVWVPADDCAFATRLARDCARHPVARYWRTARPAARKAACVS